MKESDRALIIANIWLAAAMLSFDAGPYAFTLLVVFHSLWYIVSLFWED